MAKYRRPDGTTFVLSRMDLDEYALFTEEQLDRLRAKEREAEITQNRPATLTAERDASWARFTAEKISTILNSTQV
jgi:hypothetical protein